jgi:FMN phosphatase YigB (HAD superfamily)
MNNNNHPGKNRCIVFDIDGTISDATHRLQFAYMKEWDTFNELASQDPVIVKLADFMRSINWMTNVILFTGRSEKYRYITLDWLKDAELDASFEELLMRPDNDFRPDHEVKIELLEKRFGGKEGVMRSVWFVVDDRDQVVEALRNYGLTVLQPANGGY